MRIATAYAHQSAIDGISERQRRLADSQQQISSGLRVNRPSDDPAAAAEAERLRSREARVDAEKRTLSFARQMLSTADNTIGDAVGVLQSARESLLLAGSPALSSSDRASVAIALRQHREQLLEVVNRGDGMGNFVFGGRGTSASPFAPDASSNIVYQAPSGTVTVGESFSSEVSLDGSSSFTSIARPGGPTENLFSQLDSVIAALENPATTSGAASTVATGVVQTVDRSIDRLGQTRTVVGERLKGIDVREQAMESGSIDTASRLSDLIDVDFASALSNFNQNQTAADAAMKAYAQVAKLSLFSYL
jgi:flagellar hook-associated protein 3 FlgL